MGKLMNGIGKTNRMVKTNEMGLVLIQGSLNPQLDALQEATVLALLIRLFSRASPIM